MITISTLTRGDFKYNISELSHINEQKEKPQNQKKKEKQKKIREATNQNKNKRKNKKNFLCFFPKPVKPPFSRLFLSPSSRYRCLLPTADTAAVGSTGAPCCHRRPVILPIALFSLFFPYSGWALPPSVGASHCLRSPSTSLPPLRPPSPSSTLPLRCLITIVEGINLMPIDKFSHEIFSLFQWNKFD